MTVHENNLQVVRRIQEGKIRDLRPLGFIVAYLFLLISLFYIHAPNQSESNHRYAMTRSRSASIPSQTDNWGSIVPILTDINIGSEIQATMEAGKRKMFLTFTGMALLVAILLFCTGITKHASLLGIMTVAFFVFALWKYH